jgi:hypothetical protein
MRGMFKVVERTTHTGGRHVLVKLESTQITSEMFAARIELMLTDDLPPKFPIDGEFSIDFSTRPTGK